MLSVVDEKFKNASNTKEVQEFLNNVDLEDRRVGQTYIDLSVEEDMPEGVQKMLNSGWKHSLTRNTHATKVKYVLDQVLAITMEHASSGQRKGQTY